MKKRPIAFQDFHSTTISFADGSKETKTEVRRYKVVMYEMCDIVEGNYMTPEQFKTHLRASLVQE